MNQIYSWVLTGKAGAVWDKVYKRSLMLKALKYDEIPPYFMVRMFILILCI